MISLLFSLLMGCTIQTAHAHPIRHYPEQVVVVYPNNYYGYYDRYGNWISNRYAYVQPRSRYYPPPQNCHRHRDRQIHCGSH